MPRRGRGGGSGLKNVSWEYDPNIKLETAPQEDYPPYPKLPVPSPSSAVERSQVSHYLSIRENFRSGPFFTHSSKQPSSSTETKIYNEQQANEQYGRHSAAEFDSFAGMTTWNDKYAPSKQFLPVVKGDCWDSKFLPPELYPILPPHLRPRQKMHHGKVDKLKRMKSRWEAEGAEGELIDLEEGEENAEEGGKEVEGDGEKIGEEDPEYDFEDADDEMGGDYNAEGYFDNGEGDEIDEGGDGGEDY